MKLEINGIKGDWACHGEYEPDVDTPLAACPFCGGQDILVTNTHTAAYWAECATCSAQARGVYRHGKRLATRKRAIQEHQTAFASTIAAWNRRHKAAKKKEN